MKPSEQYEKLNPNIALPAVNVILVTFNPNINDLFKNIDHFFSDITSLLLVDNSDDEKIRAAINDRCQEYNKIVFLSMEENGGIGAAQNIAIRYLFDHQHDNQELLLFFDQDSYLTGMEIKKLANDLLNEKKQNQSIVMLGATTGNENSVAGKSVVEHIISSGSITNLNAFKTIGYFDEDLFIDFIDFAWCWKAASKGFKVMIDYDVVLHHQTTGQLKTIFGKGIDNPNRLYYVYRNLIIALRRYSPSVGFSFSWYQHLFFKAAFQLLFANDRLKRAKMIAIGVRDGLHDKSGKISVTS